MTSLLVDGNWLLNVSLPMKKVEGAGDEFASYQFLQQLSKWRKSVFANRVYVVFDSGVPQFRLDYLPDYKKSRRAPKLKDADIDRRDLLRKNSKFLEDILPLLGVRVWKKRGVEGDDLLFALCQNIQDKAVILSGDMDLTQLVNNHVCLRTNKILVDHNSIKNLEMDKKMPEVKMRDGRDVVAFKALRGDSSDQISPIIRPKPFKQLWRVMMEERLDSDAGTILNLAERIESVRLDVDSLRNNWYVVDLARAPIAGGLCMEAAGEVGKSVTINESQVASLATSVGMNPAALQSVVSDFRFIK